MTKEVYNPKEHTRADEDLHKSDLREDKPAGSKAKGKAKKKPEKNERTPKINKYGFLHVDKDLAKHLGVELGKDKEDVPVTIERIEGGFVVKIVKA